MNEKLVIMDTVKNSILVYGMPQDEEEFLEYLEKENVISGLNTIHWQIMQNLTINNFTK